MAEENEGGFFQQIKNQIIAGVGVVVTAAGGLIVSNMEAIFSPEIEVVETVESANESTTDTLVVIQKEQPKVIVKEVEKKVSPKKTETEKRKEEFDW